MTWMTQPEGWENDKTKAFMILYPDLDKTLLRQMFHQRGSLVLSPHGVWYHFPPHTQLFVPDARIDNCFIWHWVYFWEPKSEPLLHAAFESATASAGVSTGAAAGVSAGAAGVSTGTATGAAAGSEEGGSSAGGGEIEMVVELL